MLCRSKPTGVADRFWSLSGTLWMMRAQGAILLLFAAALLVPSVSAADDWKVRTFNAPPDLCYKAAELAVTKHHEVQFKDPDLLVIRFKIGTTAWSYGYRMSMSISPSKDDGGCKAETHIEKVGGPVFSWGSGKKELRKVYEWLEEELATLLKEKRADERN